MEPGCYNVASIDARIGDIANLVAARFGVPCREVTRPNRYDIRVDTEAFRRASGVGFRDDVSGLIEALETWYRAGDRGAPADR